MKKETTVAQLIAKANDGIIGKKVGWEGNFNDMALKTVIRRLLSKYGYLSVEMQNAMAHDVEDEAMSNRNDTLDNAAAQTVDLSATEYEEVDTETGKSRKPDRSRPHPLLHLNTDLTAREYDLEMFGEFITGQLLHPRSGR